MIGGLICTNIGVWGMWQMFPEKTMVKHFSATTSDVLSRPHTVVTAMFSHKDGYHLLGNMLTLFFFGPECVAYVGARQFLGLYFGSGILANGCQLAVSSATTTNSYWMRERFLGASGAVNAVVAWSVLANPWRLIILFAEFIPLPMPAVVYGGVFLGKDLAPLMGIRIPYIAEGPSGSIAHVAHLIGAVCGAAHFLRFRGMTRRRW